MGYRTHVTGKFTITPPITWPEMKDSPFISRNRAASDLILEITEETVDTPDGQLIRKTAHALTTREIDEYRAYNLLEEVQRAVSAFPGHEWTGRLDCEGEDTGDLWRVIIRDGKAVKVEPRIVWPDEGGSAPATVDVHGIAATWHEPRVCPWCEAVQENCNSCGVDMNP